MKVNIELDPDAQRRLRSGESVAVSMMVTGFVYERDGDLFLTAAIPQGDGHFGIEEVPIRLYGADLGRQRG